MSVPFRPIVSALLRNRAGALLVALQIAFALALLANTTYIVKQRVEKIDRPTGIDVENIFVIMSQGFTRRFDHAAAIREDLDYLRSVDGVVAATPMSHFPLGGPVFDDELAARPGERTNRKLADYYEVDHQALEALGARLIAGRGFDESEILPPVQKGSAAAFPAQIIVTRAFAEALFPGENALGRTVYNRIDQPATIIGIVERLHGGWVDWKHLENVFLLPRVPTAEFGPRAYYVVRTEPGLRDRALRTVEEHISTSNPDRVIEEIRPLQYYKDRSYRRDRNMGILLVTVTGVLLAITALGSFGLATFKVSTRTRQIGTRRALGARRRDIIYHFMVENWLVTTIGVIVGCPLALAAGYWLSLHFQMPRLDLYFLGGGVVVLSIIGQIAAWQPARRAANVSPAVATRTV